MTAPLSRLVEDQPDLPRIDGSIHVDVPCFVCGSTAVPMDPIYDSAAPGGIRWACNDLTACLARARKNASESL